VGGKDLHALRGTQKNGSGCWGGGSGMQGSRFVVLDSGTVAAEACDARYQNNGKRMLTGVAGLGEREIDG
jgi:hypothetical protein